ncbi:MAG: efflux RND transporter periplasmic adaptor subunit [Bacteroidales bacterium]|nr:efflux RND transporter periplasmic adaptor subunit [Bacteroidales bacterium]
MKQITLFLICLIVLSCASKQNTDDQTAEKRQFLAEKNPVDIMVLKRSTFQKELVSNGKLKARSKSVLKFSAGEELVELNVKNGERVHAGQVIARLRQDKLLQQLEQAKVALEQTRFELQDLLIGQNYSLADSAKIPKKTYETVCVQSGYSAARSRLAAARLDYAATELKAPFSGIIAGLKYKLHEQVSSGSEFCTLIDNSLFEVEFPVLEPELNDVSVGKEVKVIPFSMRDKMFKGRITEINPMVDENGMIQLKATLGQAGQLMDGMNVQVLVENAVAAQLVVPKPAVVLRDNQEVLFKIVGGKAYWTYIQTLFENSESYAVIAHPEKGATLEPGDTVIVSGNLNLAHESEIVVK